MFIIKFSQCSMLLIILFILLHIRHSSGQCLSLIAPPYGVVIGSSEGVCGTEVGSVCRIECKNNCQLRGDRYHTCLPNGSWSGTASQCIDKSVRCRPKLNSPANGYIVGECKNWGGYVCTFACNADFALLGSSRVFCRKRRRVWSGATPTCVSSTTVGPVFCPTLSAPNNGAQTGFCTSDIAFAGTACVFSCNTGYELNGESVLVCNSDRTWSASAPTCDPNQCQSLSPPKHGSYYGNCNPGLSQHSCNFRCNRRYHLIGSSTLICHSSGRWSSNAPYCSRRVYSVCSADGYWKGSQKFVCRPLISTNYYWHWRRPFVANG